MSKPASRQCAACTGDVAPLRGEAVTPLLKRLAGWEVINEHHLSKQYKFPDFKAALAFVNRVGDAAEAAGHHPDIHLAWGHVRVEIWTHTINGLSEKDFLLAADIDQLPHSS